MNMPMPAGGEGGVSRISELINQVRMGLDELEAEVGGGEAELPPPEEEGMEMPPEEDEGQPLPMSEGDPLAGKMPKSLKRFSGM
jgi:hypothetical protein